MLQRVDVGQRQAGDQSLQAFLVGLRGRALSGLAAHHGHEAGAEALRAGVVLVAAGLIDRALAAVRRFQRNDRQAVRLHAAVTAAFAHRAVDQHAARRIRKLVLLAAAAFFGCAGLVMDQHGHARDLAQLALQRIQLAAVVDLDAGTQVHALVLFGLVRGDHDARHVLAAQLLADLRDRDRAIDRLPARHRHGIVEQDLVGDVGARRDGLADGQVTRVVVRAFAHVLEDVRHLRVAGQADPVDAFAAHLRQATRVAVHPCSHVVAAHAGQRLAALGHLGRRAVRTARAEVRAAAHPVRVVGQRGLAFECRQVAVHRKSCGARQPAGQRRGQQRRAQLAGRRHHRLAVQTLLAHDRGALGQVEQHVLDLAFDHRAFFFDDQDVRQAAREFEQTALVHRPGETRLVDAYRRVRRHRIHAQSRQRFHGVQVRLAHGDDAHRCLGRRTGQLVQAVAAREGGDRLHALVHARLDRQGQKVARRIFKRSGWHVRIRGHVVGLNRGGGEGVAAFDGLGHCLEGDPGAGITRQRPAPQREGLVFVDGRRMHDGHLPADQRGLAGVRDRGRYGGVVVAHHHQHAAVARGARGIAVMQRVAGAIHARALAVPHGKHAIDIAVVAHAGLLRPHHRGGGHVFVDARQEGDLVGVQRLLRLPHGHVHTAQRRSAVPRHETGRVQAALAVHPALREHHAHQGLRAGQEDAAGLARQVVGELILKVQLGCGGGGTVHSQCSSYLAP